MDKMVKTAGMKPSDNQIEKMTAQQIRELVEENQRLKEELRTRDNDILSHDQVFDSIVSGTLHVILVMSVTDFTAEFVTSNVEIALGISRADVMKDVRRLGHLFYEIEKYSGKEEIYIHQTNGTRRQYLIYVVHLPYGRSDRVAVLMLCRSTVAKGNLEEMMLQQMQDVNRAAGFFLASLSQDLHVPVNKISGFVMLLMKNAHNPSKVMEYAHYISLACQDILSTFDQAIDMSRIEMDRALLEPEEFGLGLMLEEVSAIISSLAGARDLQFIFRTTGIEHDVVLGDRGRIAGMLRLILSNSLKYTPPGGRVELNVSAAADDGDESIEIQFEVRDTGIGMDNAQIQKYFRDEIPDEETDVPGRGAGIWLTRKVVSMMGGTFTAESVPGKGTVIRIVLRLQLVSGGNSDFWRGHGIRRMLIVDKNIRESARIRNLMDCAGVKAVAVSTGYGTIDTIAQAAAVEKEYDLILVDDELQDMEWFDVMDSIRRMPWVRKPYIFLMTWQQTDEEMFRAAGVDGILQKPFFVSVLHQLVGQVCKEQTEEGRTVEEEDGALMTGLRFLAAEDNILNAKMLRDMLEMSGARCEIAGNGRAALAKFSNSKPGTYDVILMDIQMPVMDGYAAAQAIRKLDREDAASVPIIAMTASSFEEDMNRIYEAGINAHINKPMSIRTLQRHLRRILRQNKDQ